LLLDKKGTVKILDMGLARLAGMADDSTGDHLTTSGQMMGTCDYMAPEQATDTHLADARADIYSLGCTLYRLLTGEAMFQHNSLIQVVLAHRECPPPSLRTVRPDVSPQLEAIYLKMVAKRQEDRYQTMSEVIEALECGNLLSLSTASPPTEATSSSWANTESGSKLPHSKSTAAAGKTLLRTKTEETISQQAIAAETSRQWTRSAISAPLSLRERGRTRSVITLAAAMGLVGVLLYAAVVKMRTPKDGTLEVEVSDPAATVEVLNEEGKVVIESRKAGGEKIELSVPPGKGKIQVRYGDKEIVTADFSLSSGSTQLVSARLVLPSAAKDASKTSGNGPGLATAIPEEAWTPWEDLFDGKTLNGWTRMTRGWFRYAGGSVKIEDGQLRLSHGSYGVGISRNAAPNTNYEVRVEAMRVSGHRDIASLHFSVGDAVCNLAVGGFDSGDVVALDQVDRKPGDNNATTRHVRFESNRWFVVRLRVTDDRIQAWIDQEQLINLPRRGHAFSTSRDAGPFGVFAWAGISAIRSIRMRQLKPEAAERSQSAPP
jgi:hypothetical protein